MSYNEGMRVTNRLKHDQHVWFGIVAGLVLAALGLWWIASLQSVDTSGFAVFPQAIGMASSSESAYVAPINRSSRTVASIVANLSGAKQFNSLLSSTGVSADLKGSGPYTIFVPTSGAFARLPISIAGLSADDQRRLADYHIIMGTAVDVTAQSTGFMQALSGDTLNFSLSSDDVPMVNSSLIVAEYRAKNGIVYVIDTVLLPPKRAAMQ